MYRLHNLRIRGKLWQIIDDCQNITTSAAIVNPTKSRWFNVEQDRTELCQHFNTLTSLMTF